MSQDCAAAPRGPAPAGGPARTITVRRTLPILEISTTTIMLVGRCRGEEQAATELVRIPLQPEERQEPERDGKTGEDR